MDNKGEWREEIYNTPRFAGNTLFLNKQLWESDSSGLMIKYTPEKILEYIGASNYKSRFPISSDY